MEGVEQQDPSFVAAAAKSLQSCPTLCDPIDGSPPGSPVPGILQARTLEWVAISFSDAWKWKVKVKSLSPVWLFSRPHGLQPTRLLRPWDFSGKSTGVGCHRLLRHSLLVGMKNVIAILKDSLRITYKTKHTFTMSSNCTPRFLLKGDENLYPH